MDKPNEIRNRRILVVDDDASVHEMYRQVLTTASAGKPAAGATQLPGFANSVAAIVPSSFELDCVLQGQEAVERVREARTLSRPYAVAFVDMHMPPGWDGAETIEKLWAIAPDLQVVICSAYSDRDWMQIIARLGHADKLLIIKMPFEPIEVLQCARALSRKWLNERGFYQRMHTLEQVASAGTAGLELANKQLRHLATHDALTGLPNRILLEDRLTQAMAHAERNGTGFALLMVDIDKLKLVNDSLGHGAGDELLQEVARRLRSTVRDVDTLARVAGDEFLMIINSPADARDIAGRALEALKSPTLIAGVEMHTTVSIGMAFFPKDATTIEGLIARAGAAMYHAKEHGRNTARCFTSGMDTPTRETARLQSDLHAALSLQQFELHYQPKVDVATGAVRSAEALIRWRHPERGLVPPAQFIPFAEESGLIGAIGEWVVREACRQAAVWRHSGLPIMRIAVNLSASQFRHGRLLETVKEALRDAELDPTYLEVELTESAVMNDPQGSIWILEQLSAMGVLVSVDDFGTGYSSMAYLRRLPIDKLKIDRTFIGEIATRSDDASIVRAIVFLAHSLKLKVIAEGVETSEQLEFLKSVGCDQYQGYLFSKALPAAEFEELIRSLHHEAEREMPESEFDRTYSKLSGYRIPKVQKRSRQR
jgi:diguanylate cyclase (GGDEF)-like protein